MTTRIRVIAPSNRLDIFVYSFLIQLYSHERIST
nr:MAG TPA: hypothetical protein [Caudoviricetes sp.]DAU41378.1 MAG TPA: hypothetical protein [Bacteriophage sp.]